LARSRSSERLAAPAPLRRRRVPRAGKRRSAAATGRGPSCCGAPSVSTCSSARPCKGRTKLVAMLTEPKRVRRFLAALGQPTDVPARSPSRVRRTGRAPSCAVSWGGPASVALVPCLRSQTDVAVRSNQVSGQTVTRGCAPERWRNPKSPGTRAGLGDNRRAWGTTSDRCTSRPSGRRRASGIPRRRWNSRSSAPSVRR
jgi:hypothetical protein